MTTVPGTRVGGMLATLSLVAAVAVLVLGLTTQVARGAVDADVDGLLQRMKAAYDGAPAVHATFVQTNTGMSYFEPLVMKGTLSLERPRRIRMAYTSPRAKTYLSDGSTLWIVDDSDKTVQRSRGQSDALGRLFDFLTGSADVKRDFTLAVEDGKEGREGFVVLRMKPKTPDAAFSLVYVHVHPETGFVHGVVTMSSLGDRSETLLNELTTPEDLPDADFVYTEKPGYTVVDLDGP